MLIKCGVVFRITRCSTTKDAFEIATNLDYTRLTFVVQLGKLEVANVFLVIIYI